MTPIINCIVTKEQIHALAKHIYTYAQKENVRLIFLRGQVGAGKTTFCQAFINQGDENMIIQSPTYTYMNEYFVNNHYIWHFDLYRIKHEDQLTDLGILDYIHREDGIALIEWPEKLSGLEESYKIITLHFHHIEQEDKRAFIMTTNY
jgi:tRNA threonylcarbamoyladenosine biosynthesis protein TsaE